jgi:hypothetical protein
MLISQSGRKAEIMYPVALLSSFLLKPQGNVATDQAKFAKTN